MCVLFSLWVCRMDDIQLCKEITRLKKELHKLVSIPGGTSRVLKKDKNEDVCAGSVTQGVIL